MKFLAVIIFSLICIVFSPQLQAQHDTTEITFIRSFPNHFYLKVISSTKIFNVAFEDIQSETGVPKREYTPRTGAFFGIGAYAFDMGLEVSFKLPDNSEDAQKYGNSSGVDWQAHMLGRRFGLDFAYQDYTGLYLKDPYQFYNTNAEAHAFRADMKVNSLSFNLLYVFSPDNFSFPAVFNHSEQQIRSAGSFLLSGLATFTKLDADYSFVENSDKNNFSSNTGMYHISSNTYGVLPGYAYNIIVKRNIYFALSGALGPAFQNSTIKDSLGTHDFNRLTLATNWRIGIGYNNPTFFAGMSVYYAQNAATFNNIRLSTNSGFFRMFFGYRIREWGVLKKSIFDLLPFLQTKYSSGYGLKIDG